MDIAAQVNMTTFFIVLVLFVGAVKLEIRKAKLKKAGVQIEKKEIFKVNQNLTPHRKKE